MQEDYSHLTSAERKFRTDEAQAILDSTEKIIEFNKALTKLKNTPEYKLVFIDGYFNEFARNIFEEMTNPKQFAIIPLQDCEDTLLGIKALKTYVGFKEYKGTVELEAQTAELKNKDARLVLDAIGF